MEKAQEYLCEHLTWKRGAFCPVKTSVDLLKAEMKGWMPRGYESCFQRKPYFFHAVEKKELVGEIQKNIYRPG